VKKSLIVALIIMALTVVVLIMQGTNDARVDMYFTHIDGWKSMIFLAFTAIGVAIGVLLK
jgi:hypothetical protein